MPDISFVLFDTAVFGVAASDQSLFQVSMQGDATHTENFTNSRGAGSLPQNEKFTLKEIGVFPETDLLIADIEAMQRGSFIEVIISDVHYMKIPLQLCMKASGYGGHFGQAAAADAALIGVMNDGYKLEIPIEIPGGTQFRIRVVQGTALGVASKNVKVCLIGILSIP